MPSLPLLLLLSVLLLGGCRNITGPAGSGTYTAEVAGALTASYSGRMLYGPSSVTAGPGYDIHLQLPGEEPYRGIIFHIPARPRVGRYTVVARQDLDRAEVFSSLLLPTAVFLGNTGELHVTRTNPLRGTFLFQARRNSGETITVSGEFTEE
ncbi:MAG TPA: hypothetical protein VGR37_24095 [Longimicrobiaceae bacterium]|nr:hypothetical protein [Longimicrobiaceae bacterium]